VTPKYIEEKMTRKVKVEFFGVVRDLVGKTPRVDIELPDNAPVRDLLYSLFDIYGPKLRERILTSDGEMQSYVKIFINNASLEYGDLEKDLENFGGSASEVAIFIVPAQVGG
jgi:molybdopterin converting factor small subunit